MSSSAAVHSDGAGSVAPVLLSPVVDIRKERKLGKVQALVEAVSFVLAGSTFAMALNVDPIAAVAYSTISYLAGKLAYWASAALGESWSQHKTVVRLFAWTVALTTGVLAGAALLGPMTVAHSLAIATLSTPVALAVRWALSSLVPLVI